MRMKVAPKVQCQSKPCFKELTKVRAMRIGDNKFIMIYFLFKLHPITLWELSYDFL